MPEVTGRLRDRLNKIVVQRQALETNSSVRRIFQMPDLQLRALAALMTRAQSGGHLAEATSDTSSNKENKEMWQEHSAAAASGKKTKKCLFAPMTLPRSTR